VSHDRAAPGLPADIAVKLVIAAMSPSRGSIVECSHQLGRAFAQGGHQVLHLSTPVSPAHIARLGRIDVWRRLHASFSGAVRLEPGLLDLVSFTLLPSWVPGHVGSARNPMLVTVFPGLRRVLRGLGFQQVDAPLVGQLCLRGSGTTWSADGSSIITRTSPRS
jgi:hypothetical protein